VGKLQHALETLQFPGVHAQLAHTPQGCVLPQQAQHHRLAVQHRNDRHPDIHFTLINPDFDPAILRQTFFRDVQVAQNFDAGHDGRLKPLDLRRDRHVLQHAVNAVTNAQLVLERLEVDIRGAQLDGVAQHLVDEADDGGVFGRAVEVGFLLGMLVHHLERGLLVQGVKGVRAHAEALFHFALDHLAAGQDRPEVQAGQGLQRIHPLGGEQAAGGHFHHPVEPPQRQQLLFQENPSRKEREQLPVRLDILEVGKGQAVFPGQPA